MVPAPHHFRIPPPDGFPLFGWNVSSTARYFADHPPCKGDLLLIYNGQAGLHEYVLSTVVEANQGRQKRIVMQHSAAWGGKSFYRTGLNCWSPRGQSRLLPPVPVMMKYFKDIGASTISVET